MFDDSPKWPFLDYWLMCAVYCSVTTWSNLVRMIEEDSLAWRWSSLFLVVLYIEFSMRSILVGCTLSRKHPLLTNECIWLCCNSLSDVIHCLLFTSMYGYRIFQMAVKYNKFHEKCHRISNRLICKKHVWQNWEGYSIENF